MSTNKTEEPGLEFIESPEELANQLDKAEDFFRKNNSTLLTVGGVILAAIIGFVGYRFYMDGKEKDAQSALYSAVYDYESDSLALALSGKGGNEGLLSISENYGGTDAANLASFYAGVALLKQGKYDEAIDKLKSFSSSDLLVQGRALSLIGDAYMEKNDVNSAIDFYKKASEYESNQFFTPGYLMKLGVAYESAKKYKEAATAYSKIINEFPMASEVMNAKKYLGVVEGQVGE